MRRLTMTVREVIPVTELFSTFRQRILTSPSVDAASLIRELCDDAATVRSFAGLTDRYSFFTWLRPSTPTWCSRSSCCCSARNRSPSSGGFER